MKNKIIIGWIVISLLVITGCKGNGVNETVENAKEAESTKLNEETKSNSEIIKTVYGKLSKDDKTAIVNLDKATLEEVNLGYENSIYMVSDINDLDKYNVYKISYQTEDSILGDIVVYVNSSNLEILGYGFRD